MNTLASFYYQGNYLGCASFAEIDDKVGVTLRNLRLATCHSLHASLIDQPSGEIARWIFEDGTGALLRRLRPLPVLFMVFDNGFQFLRIIAVQPQKLKAIIE